MSFWLGFEVVYYVLEARYNTFTAIQQRLNLQLLARLRQAGGQLGVPSRLWVQGDAICAPPPLSAQI